MDRPWRFHPDEPPVYQATVRSVPGKKAVSKISSNDLQYCLELWARPRSLLSDTSPSVATSGAFQHGYQRLVHVDSQVGYYAASTDAEGGVAGRPAPLTLCSV